MFIDGGWWRILVMKLFNLMGIHKLPITNHGSLQNPKQGSLKITPLQDPGSLQNPKQGSLKCTLKKYPLKPLQNHKHESNAHCTATPKYPSTKSQTFGSCPYTLKNLYYKIPLYSPKGLAFYRGNSWGITYITLCVFMSQEGKKKLKDRITPHVNSVFGHPPVE